MQRHLPLTVAGLALCLLAWLPLGIAGVPLDTPDGFLHLGWAVGWARQVAGGWWWPQWTDLPWAGAGSHALAIYPPLFRHLVGVPLLFGAAPDHALAGALLVVMLVNAGGAITAARLWLPQGPGRWLLLLVALANPYFLINVYVRGAWPEALAQALFWWWAAGLAQLLARRRRGIWLVVGAVAGIVLSNWNATLLILLLGAGTAALLLLRRQWEGLSQWCLGYAVALAITAPFWWPALQLLTEVRAPIPAGLFTHEFFSAQRIESYSFARLLWIQAITIAALLALRGLVWGWGGDGLARWGLLVALISLGMTLEPSEPTYHLVPGLERIQFPWRWLGPAWLGTGLWLSSGPQRPRPLGNPWQRLGCVALALISLGSWFDSLWRFRTNLVDHGPSAAERASLRTLLRCDPLQACPDGVRARTTGTELPKRFVALADGRIALAGVPDYSPSSIPAQSWLPRLQTFWVPTWPQPRWATFSGRGSVQLLAREPRLRRWRITAQSPGVFRVMQWATPRWQVQWSPARGSNTARTRLEPIWSQPMAAGGRDKDGWVAVPLQPGSWLVQLTYVDTPPLP